MKGGSQSKKEVSAVEEEKKEKTIKNLFQKNKPIAKKPKPTPISKMKQKVESRKKYKKQTPAQMKTEKTSTST